MKAESFTLAEALPQEIARCQELLLQYDAIGPAGTFGAIMIKNCIEYAIRVMAEGDVVEMIRAYNALKDCE